MSQYNMVCIKSQKSNFITSQKIQANIEMSKLIVVIMQQNDYPFGEYDNSHLEKKKVMVRKRIQFHPLQKKSMILKAKKLKSFNNQYIIKLQQLLEEDTSIHLLFQYVPIKIQTWISNINPQFIENFRHQLMQLAEYLAQNNIVIYFKLRNIGMNQDYSPKYFIGMDYEINAQCGKDHLFQKYSTQINQILNPYQQFIALQNKKSILGQPNPELNLSRKQQNLKRYNEKSYLSSNLNLTARRNQDSKNQTVKHQFVKNPYVFNQFDMKLTFDAFQKPKLSNLPKNITTNIKIQNIGKKINDLRNLIQNINNKTRHKKHDSLSLSPMKNNTQQRPNSSYQKELNISQQYIKNSGIERGIKTFKNNFFNDRSNQNQQSQIQTQSKYCQNLNLSRDLNKNKQKGDQNNINKEKIKKQIKVGGNKQSYIFQFERLLDDDNDASSLEDKRYDKLQIQENKIENKSPRFGFSSGEIKYQKHKTEPQRYSYPHNTKKRKKSSQSYSSKGSDIKQRVDAVIGASRRLIDNFRKNKLNDQKKSVISDNR